jgi:hypothetical protein
MDDGQTSLLTMTFACHPSVTIRQKSVALWQAFGQRFRVNQGEQSKVPWRGRSTLERTCPGVSGRVQLHIALPSL